ncbi:MAG: hypothetical protein GX678_02900 [Actinomycetales bacterium]|nr:hypothetical protein [Actinomycetales bacterium]
MLSRLTRFSLSAIAAFALVVGLTFSSTPAHASAKKPGKFRISAVSPGVSSVSVRWTKSKGATSYRVCLLPSSGAKKCGHTSAVTKNQSVAFFNLKPTGGTDWFARVEAFNKKGKRVSGKKGFDLRVPAVGNVIDSNVATTSFTTAWPATFNAGTYATQISTDSKFKKGVTTATVSTRSRVFTGLKANTKYYVRVQGRNGNSHGPWSTVRGISTKSAATAPVPDTPKPVPPSTPPTTPVAQPSAPTYTAGYGGFLRFGWAPVIGASDYDVQISPIPDFSSRVSTVPTSTTSIELRGLNGGSVYYTRIRAITNGTAGAWGPVTTVKLQQPAINVSIVTYNLCGQNKCRGTNAAFNANVPVWEQRKAPAADLVSSVDPDIIATQESHSTQTAFHSAFSGYSLGTYKSAKSLSFRSDKFTSAGGGWITLDSATSKFATWEKLRVSATGSTFYVVNAHLTSGKGAAKDKQRELEMSRMYTAVAKENVYGVPVLWAGDWNSNADNANQSKYKGGYDAPRNFFARYGIRDSVTLAAANRKVNAQLNSSNYGEVTPKTSGHHIDAILVGPGAVVNSWALVTRFTDGSSVFSTGKRFATPLGSDHNPVLASVTLPAV